MSAKIQTQPGHAIPPAPRHAITVHLPLWSNLLRFADRDPVLLSSLKSMYPRMLLHKDVKELIQKFMEKAGVEGQTCIPYTSPEAAAGCKAFATSKSRGEDAIPESDVTIRVFDIQVRFYVVFIPAAKFPIAHPFWSNTGLGVSSRLAEESLQHLDLLREVSESETRPKPERVPAHAQIRERIAGLMERAPVGPAREAKVSADDVYLFQTGMASIYSVHKYLLDRYNAKSVLYGFAFHSTIHVFEDFGPGFKFLGLGTAEEINELEEYLQSEAKEGRKVQAVWAEYPSNPLIVTPDLGRLRQLADKYGFALIVDDTIGSFCNVDLLGVADIIVTSLTKSFSGYADVMGASAVLNPSSARYSEFKKIFQESYRDEYSNGDAIQMESNSRDYLSRSTILNNNALRLVEYLQTQAADPKSSVSQVHYTTIGDSLPHYTERMRQPTDEFTPGYGCLFSVEFNHIEATKAFYDNLNVHQGPHLGAHLTLAIPYVRGLYGKELEWVGKYGLRPTQIRIAVGLEDTEILLEDFRVAVRAADAVITEE